MFLHDTLVHNNALIILNLVQKIQQFRWYHLGKHQMKFWTFVVNLTLNTAIRCFHKTDVPPDEVWLQKDQQFKKYSRNSHILIICTVSVTWTLKTSTPFFSIRYSSAQQSTTISSLVAKGWVVQMTPSEFMARLAERCRFSISTSTPPFIRGSAVSVPCIATGRGWGRSGGGGGL